MGNTSQTTTSTAGTDTQTFSYDHLNRPTDAIATGGVVNYTHNSDLTDYNYDKLGNVDYFGNNTQYDYTNWSDSCPFPIPTRPMPQAVRKIGSQYFYYDANGNPSTGSGQVMTSRSEGSTTYTQNFNVENELSSVVAGINQTTSFTYDAAGT